MLKVFVFLLFAIFVSNEELATTRIESRYSANEALMVMASTRERKEIGLDAATHEEAKKVVLEMLSKINSLTHKAMQLQNEKSKDEVFLRSELTKIDQEIAKVQQIVNKNAQSFLSELEDKQKRSLTAILVLRQRELAVLNQYVAEQIKLPEDDRLELIIKMENSLRDFTIECKHKLSDCKESERTELTKKFMSEWNEIARRTVRDFLSSTQCSSYESLSREADAILAARKLNGPLPR